MRALLAENDRVRVHLDPRCSGVVVPRYLYRKEHIAIELGLDMPEPIHDLRVDETGIFGTLFFKRCGHFACFVPWSAVFAILREDHWGMAWREDAPTRIQKRLPVRLRLVK